MNEAINHLDTTAEFYTPERCYIIELSNTPEDPEVSIARARVAPGITTRWHRVVGVTERYVIVSGTGRMEVGSLAPQDVSAGDVVFIPPSCRQRISNTGAADLVFLAICSPRFRPQLYEDIDDAAAECRADADRPVGQPTSATAMSSIDLRQALSHLLPGAIAWAEAQAQRAAETGTALSPSEQEIARCVGVERPDLIRVVTVERLPQPEDPVLRAAAEQAGLAGPDMIGLTLGHAVFVRRGHQTRRLLSHEFRHVHQYERHGSIAAFLPIYLSQIVELGYADSPFEKDARAHELRDV